MGILKDYYRDVCKKRQEELLALYSENRDTSYRWQDIVEQTNKTNDQDAR